MASLLLLSHTAAGRFYTEGVARIGPCLKHHQKTSEEEEELWDHRSDRELEVYPLSEQLCFHRAIAAYLAEYWESWDDDDDDGLNGNNCQED